LLSACISFAQLKMKKIFAILILLAFATQFVPAVQSLVYADTISLVEIDEEQSPEKKKDAGNEKKEIKDFLHASLTIPMEVTLKFSYIHSSHLLGDCPAADILTPPPNKA
jgi:Na+-transporting methylmalonyl-CoA/oxaloacetate decarboxylase gamma subunit